MRAIVIFVAALLGIFGVIIVGEMLRSYGYPGWANIVSILGLGLITIFVIKASEKK